MNLIDETPGLSRYLETVLGTSTGEDEQPLDECYTLDSFAPIARLRTTRTTPRWAKSSRSSPSHSGTSTPMWATTA